MKSKKARWLRPVLFTVGGALAGLACYFKIGCPTGGCPITANPISSMLYMGLVGYLLSGLFEKRCSRCNT
ncbi:MAG: hypothetical protein Q4A66_11625 [Eubacteriales bacterium]|nr:hypothetical protein [Eubacteriales bacterium]